MRKRGMLTIEVEQIALDVLEVTEFSQAELRLMPYVQFVLMNDQYIDPNKVTQAERDILSSWRKKGWIEGGAAGLGVSKEFWDAMSEILWHSYVDIN